MTRKTAVWSLGILGLALVLLAAGCAKQAPPPPSGPSPQPPEEPAPASPERPAYADDDLDIENLTVLQLNEMGLLADIHFDFDKYELRRDALQILRQNAAFLRRYPTIRIQIEGHCDERGTNEYNLALGDRRAHAAKGFLDRLGVYPGRIGTISYGEERPLDPGHDEEAWARNRRAHFRIVAR